MSNVDMIQEFSFNLIAFLKKNGIHVFTFACCSNAGMTNYRNRPQWTTAELYLTKMDLFWTGLPILGHLTAYQSPNPNPTLAVYK